MIKLEKSLTYADAGVDISKAGEFVKAIKAIASKTPRTGVMGEIGGFGGLYSLNMSDYERPVLVSATDGVGTKLKIAFMMNKHDTIGIDLVAMCVNDVAVQGAKPLFFLDYLSMGQLRTDVAEQIVEGIAEGCRQAQCALIGGETAEMPGLYTNDEYDLAGFAVGIVDNDKIVDGSEIKVGHKLVGIASSGLHSNGYSLVRKICFDLLKLNMDTNIPEFGKTLGEELIIPTRIYVDTILRLCKEFPIHGLAHITGGGIDENIIRVLPTACGVVIHEDAWPVPPVFKFLREAGNVEPSEMHRTFNMGLGLIAVVPPQAAQDIVERVAGMNEKGYVIGEVVQNRKSSSNRVTWSGK
jgi:phosphoribosylformylglycinamidine cyclo-ligase